MPTPILPVFLKVPAKRLIAGAFVASLAGLLLPGHGAASPIPSAETHSAMTVSIQLQNANDLEFIANPAARLYAKTTSATSALSTSTRSMQEALGLPLTAAPAPSLHSSHADIKSKTQGDIGISLGGPVSESGQILSFDVQQRTQARAWTPELLFSRAVAKAQSTLWTAVLRETAPSTEESRFLDIVWDVRDYYIKAEPTTSLGKISDTVTVLQIGSDGRSRIDTVGFTTTLENGNRAFEIIGPADSNVTEDWPGANLIDSTYETAVSPEATSLVVSIPILDDFATPGQAVGLVVQHKHDALAYEAPARAAPQVLEQAGYQSDSGDDPSPRIYWDPAAETLSLDPLPINLLEGGKNGAGGATGPDPLLRGFLEIDALEYVTDADGRRYFSGDQFRLLDNRGNTLLRATLPALVFEDSLYPHQGFNLFAPILNIIEEHSMSSDWLESFLARMTPTSLQVPELFLGFDHGSLGENTWETGFDLPVYGVLSFSGIPVPVPGTLWLIALAFVLHVSMTRHGGLRPIPCSFASPSHSGDE